MDKSFTRDKQSTNSTDLLAALTCMLLEDHLVRAQEPAGAAVGVGVPWGAAADLGTEDPEAFGLGDPAAHRAVPGDDGHAPQDDPCCLVFLRVDLDVLAHLGVAGGGEGALLALPAEADVVLQLVLAAGGEAAELAHELLLWWWRNWLGLLLLDLLLLLLLDLLLLLLL